MSKIDELKQKEIEELHATEQVFNLESLITDGTDAKVPIRIKYPKPDGTEVTAGAMIRPVNNIEVNNAGKLSFNKNSKTSYDMEIVKCGLYTMDGDKFPTELLTHLPGGVVTEIALKILEISGIKQDEKEQAKLARDMLGF